jgi:ribose transport system substrate-binding protein
LKIIASESGDFNRSDAQKVIETIIQSCGTEIDAVFGHSDEEGVAAIQAFKAVGIIPNKDVYIVTMCGMKDALKAIVGGDLLASIECNPRLGPIAFDTIEAVFKGEDVPVYIEMPGKTYDISNAEALMSEGY